MATITDLTESIRQLTASTSAEVRDYQVELVTEACGHFVDNIPSVMVNSPTGSGKSAVGLLVARYLRELDPDCGVAWVAMRRNLLRQIVGMSERLDIQIPGLLPLSMFNNKPPKEDADGRPIRLVITDEAHHASVDSLIHLLNTLTPVYHLGLTATPFRSDRAELSFAKTIRSIGIHQLIERGYLSQYRLWSIPEWSVDTVTRTYLDDPKRWGQSVFFWLNREQAQDCTNRLNAAGHRTELVTADSDRESQLEAFESGEVQCLCNMVILTEGFDSPRLQTVFARDSGRGTTIQICGRVFRKYPGVKYKNIVQSKNTRWPFIRTASPAESYVLTEDGWRSYKPSKDVEKVSARAMMTMATSVVELPKLLTKHLTPQRRIEFTENQNTRGRRRRR